MSFQAQVNIQELLIKIESILCEKCKKKLNKLVIPVSQSVSVKELMTGDK